MVRVMIMIISAVTGTLIIRCCVRVSTSRIVHDCASRERTPRALIDQIIAAAVAINTVELIRIALLLVIRKTRLAAVNTVVVAPFVLGGLVVKVVL